MAETDKIKSKLIDKIMSIRNKDFLLALDRLISTSNQSKSVSLTSEQIEMLKMSEEDIKEGLGANRFESG